jgi:hypothetical protein
MTYIHEDPEFHKLLAQVADSCDLDEPMVEKDYWITHTLWALENAGLEVWFKGGTSLSKGFGIIQRFSEDLDLKIDPGTTTLPTVSKWKSGGKAGVEERKAFFLSLAKLPLTGLTLHLDEASLGRTAEGAKLKVDYPGIHLERLSPTISPFVLLEVGDARVRPSLLRPISSLVHDHIEKAGLTGSYFINRPAKANCIHPLVTLIEKLDAISHRFAKEEQRAAAFVRHYEDAAHIIRGMGTLPPMDGFDHVGSLVKEMRWKRQIRKVPEPGDDCFNPSDSPRWDQVRHASADIQPLYWGPRLSSEETTEDIRTFLGGLKIDLEIEPTEPDDDDHDPFSVGLIDKFLKSPGAQPIVPSTAKDGTRKGR